MNNLHDHYEEQVLARALIESMLSAAWIYLNDGIESGAIMFLRNAWYAAGWSHELAAGELKQHFLLGEPVLLVRGLNGKFVALEDRCAHRAAALSRGRIEADGVRCMYHGLKFDLASGKCIEIPGQPKIPDSHCVRRYATHEREGWLFVWMGDPDKADVSLVPPVVGPASSEWTVACSYMDYQANYVLLNDNLCDFSHLAFVHINSFGGGHADALQCFAQVRPTIEGLDRGIRVSRWMEGRQRAPSHLTPDGLVDNYQTYDFLAPGVLLMWNGAYQPGTSKRLSGGRPEADMQKELLYADFTSQAVTPLTETTSRYYFTWGPRVGDVQPGMVEGMRQLAIKAFTEDRDMIEAQQVIHAATPSLKFNPTVHDRGPNQMRLVMERLIKAEQNEVSTASVVPA